MIPGSHILHCQRQDHTYVCVYINKMCTCMYAYVYTRVHVNIALSTRNILIIKGKSN